MIYVHAGNPASRATDQATQCAQHGVAQFNAWGWPPGERFGLLTGRRFRDSDSPDSQHATNLSDFKLLTSNLEKKVTDG